CYHDDSTFRDMEYKHITDTLSKLCETVTFDTFGSLTKKSAALQTMYWLHNARIMCFSQLSWHLPSILEIISPSSDEMVLHLHGAKQALAALNPPLERTSSEIKQWLQRIQYSQIAIYSCLSLTSNAMLQEFIEARKLWQLTLATKLFVEHIMLHHENTVAFARRIYTILKHKKNMD
ncbi:hypothetical protein EMCRGX_G030527, partial [Ephydatia muelleri]